MKSSELVALMFSPQWVAKLLHHFITGACKVNQAKGIKTELLYFSLPFILDDITRKKLIKANSRSTYASIFLKEKNKATNDSLEIKNALTRKNNQIKQHREYINKGLIYLGSSGSLVIGNTVYTTSEVKYSQEHGINREYCKAAFYFGIILAKEDHRDIFVKLGVTNI